jgi:hypothetical protein
VFSGAGQPASLKFLNERIKDMKKLFKSMFQMMILAGLFIAVSAVKNIFAGGTIYTGVVSSYTITDPARKGASINKATVKIAKIVISNSGDTAQTIVMYSNANATSTVTAVATWDIMN